MYDVRGLSNERSPLSGPIFCYNELYWGSHPPPCCWVSMLCMAVAFKLTELVEQPICIRFCVKLQNSSTERIQMIQKAFGMIQIVQCKYKSVTETLQRWLRICWRWFTFWKTCNKQNNWECWMCMGCNKQRLVTDSAKTRNWSGYSKNDCVCDCDEGSWHKMYCGKIRSAPFVTRTERT